MRLETISVTSMQENAYFYYDETSGDAVVIDPGGEEDKLCDYININKLNIKGILLTHGHGDHICAVEAIRKLTGAPLVIHKDEAVLLGNKTLNMSEYFNKNVELTADLLLADGDVFEFGGTRLKVLHTPGHTPGGVSYYDEEEKILFSGDTLFYCSIGRSDFTLSDTQALFDSLLVKLMALPDDVKVYPGHGSATSIGFERKHNPFINGK